MCVVYTGKNLSSLSIIFHHIILCVYMCVLLYIIMPPQLYSKSNGSLKGEVRVRIAGQKKFQKRFVRLHKNDNKLNVFKSALAYTKNKPPLYSIKLKKTTKLYQEEVPKEELKTRCIQCWKRIGKSVLVQLVDKVKEEAPAVFFQFDAATANTQASLMRATCNMAIKKEKQTAFSKKIILNNHHKKK